jgi:hypothetical protein
MPGSQQREVQLAVEVPGAGAGVAPEQRTVTVTAAAGVPAEQLKPGIVQGLQQALAQLGLAASDSGQLESVADTLVTQLASPADGETGADNLPLVPAGDAARLGADLHGLPAHWASWLITWARLCWALWPTAVRLHSSRQRGKVLAAETWLSQARLTVVSRTVVVCSATVVEITCVQVCMWCWP